MIIENDLKLDFNDVLIRPKRSTLESRRDVDLYRNYEYRNCVINFEDKTNRAYRGIPIMASNMDGVGTFAMAEELAKFGMFTCLVKHYSTEDLSEWIDQRGHLIPDNWAYSMGITEKDEIKLARLMEMTDYKIKYICIDVANGYTETFIKFVSRIRREYPHLVIIAGNVVTREITEELILNGADIIKVGIGPGSVCTTRIKTGVGYPQLSSIIECADAAHGLGGHIIADGGCVSPGDVAKAFGGGADFVMLGGMLAGHAEGGSEIVGDKVKFYGMSSKAANDKHFGGLKNYRSSEGREVMLSYKGKVEDTILDILGGLRSACTYVGASKLKYLSKCTTFIRTNNQYNKVFEKST